jgi:hypothetical protein
VSLFPMVDYPTLPLCVHGLDTANVWDRMRVRLLPDTVGLMIAPVPKVAWSGRTGDSLSTELPAELLTAGICVDEKGDSRVRRISANDWRWRRLFVDYAHNRRFFPAIDFAGNPHRWCGRVFVRYLDKLNARIWFSWSPQSDPGALTSDSAGQ